MPRYQPIAGFRHHSEILRVYQKYRVADKTLQKGDNKVFISVIIEAHSHAYPRTIDLFQVFF
jgi:hypothetical protein